MRLPDKLHELLHLALHDLEMVQKDPSYTINMGDWHNYSSRVKTCYVCLAGCVMANSLEVPYAVTIEPANLGGSEEDDHNAKCLYALDRLRLGRVGEAIAASKGIIYTEPTKHPLDFDAIDYHCATSLWFKQMKELEQELEERNL